MLHAGQTFGVTGRLSLFERRVTGKHRMGGLGAWVRRSAAFPLRLYLLSGPPRGLWLGPGVVGACARSLLLPSKSRLYCAASLRRTARVPRRRLVAQRCMKTGQCVLSSLSVKPNCSLANAWTPCLLTNQWNGRRGMHKNPAKIHIVTFRASRSPDRKRSWCHEFGIAENVRRWPFHRHVEVTAHEVDVKQLHVRVDAEGAKWRRLVSWRPRCVGRLSRT